MRNDKFYSYTTSFVFEYFDWGLFYQAKTTCSSPLSHLGVLNVASAASRWRHRAPQPRAARRGWITPKTQQSRVNEPLSTSWRTVAPSDSPRFHQLLRHKYFSLSHRLFPPQVASDLVLVSSFSPGRRTSAVVALARSLKLFPGSDELASRGNDARCTTKRRPPSKSPAMEVSTCPLWWLLFFVKC